MHASSLDLAGGSRKSLISRFEMNCFRAPVLAVHVRIAEELDPFGIIFLSVWFPLNCCFS